MRAVPPQALPRHPSAPRGDGEEGQERNRALSPLLPRASRSGPPSPNLATNPATHRGNRTGKGSTGFRSPEPPSRPSAAVCARRTPRSPPRPSAGPPNSTRGRTISYSRYSGHPQRSSICSHSSVGSTRRRRGPLTIFPLAPWRFRRGEGGCHNRAFAARLCPALHGEVCSCEVTPPTSTSWRRRRPASCAPGLARPPRTPRPRPVPLNERFIDTRPAAY